MLRTVALSAAFLTLSAPALAQAIVDKAPWSKTVLEADQAQAREDYASAEKLYREAAEQGEAVAQEKLGLLYASGRVGSSRKEEGAHWLQRAAEQGQIQSQYELAKMFANGRGVSQSYAEAMRWYKICAAQSYAACQHELAVMYAFGRGVPENYQEAIRLYSLAAEAGFAESQHNLGVIYQNGVHALENYAEAFRLYQLAAEQGFGPAQLKLARLIVAGYGARGSEPPDLAEAYKWFSLAARDSQFGADRDLAALQYKMIPSQIAEGQRRAAAWKPRTKSTAAESMPVPTKPSAATEVEATGSGFFVTATGHIITNAHVVERCAQVSIRNGSALSVLEIDAESDLALLKASDAQGRVPLFIRQGRGVRLADSVLVAGFPLSGLLSSGLNVTTGTVSALAGIGDDRRRIQITAPVQPGNSGGPLLDGSGNLVGVVVSKLNAAKVASVTGDIPQNVNFAVSLGTLQAFLDANGVDYQTRASSTTKSNADVAELARAATVQIECRN